jgi:hypothetical protein
VLGGGTLKRGTSRRKDAVSRGTARAPRARTALDARASCFGGGVAPKTAILRSKIIIISAHRAEINARPGSPSRASGFHAACSPNAAWPTETDPAPAHPRADDAWPRDVDAELAAGPPGMSPERAVGAPRGADRRRVVTSGDVGCSACALDLRRAARASSGLRLGLKPRGGPVGYTGSMANSAIEDLIEQALRLSMEDGRSWWYGCSRASMRRHRPIRDTRQRGRS